MSDKMPAWKEGVPQNALERKAFETGVLLTHFLNIEPPHQINEKNCGYETISYLQVRGHTSEYYSSQGWGYNFENQIAQKRIDALVDAQRIIPLEERISIETFPTVLIFSNYKAYLETGSGFRFLIDINKYKKQHILENKAEGEFFVQGESHHSSQGDLESNLWSWGVFRKSYEEIPQSTQLKFRSSEAMQFIQEITPHLPKDYLRHLVAPSQTGDSWIFRIGLNQFTNKEQAQEIIKKYFIKQ
jgi:hypothetical protein